MIPFSRILNYGNDAIDTRPEYTLSASANAYLFLDPETNILYGRGSRGTDFGLLSDSAYNTFIRTAKNVKRILTTRNGGSNFNAYLSTDNRVYFAGNNMCIKGTLTTVINYTGWEDNTSLFINAGINPDDIKEIQGFYNLKLNVVMKNGDLYCAGINNIATKSSFGTGNNTPANNSLVKVPLSNVKCADGNLYVTNDGELYTTGTNDQYQYGNGSNISSPNLTKIVSTSVVDAHQGHQSSYYLDDKGVVHGCGTQFGTQYGNEFGTGTGGPYTYYSYIDMYSNVTKLNICRGNMSTVVITENKECYSTGLNSNATFGNGKVGNTYTWVKALGALDIDLSRPTTVMRTNSSTMILSDGKLYQAGMRYGSGLGTDTIYAETPLTFLQGE